MFFLGEYEHSIDAKQRLAIPAEVRDVLNPEIHGVAFVAAPGGNGSLWLWPEKPFETLSKELAGSLLGNDDLDDFERLVYSQSARVPLDSAGRIRIPARLLDRYNLTNSVTVLGVRDHLELMKPKSWREEQSRLEPARTDIWRRARQAMADRRSGKDQ